MPSPYPPGAPGRPHLSLLEQRCLSFLSEGLAPTTRRSYASAQNRFHQFCIQSGRIHANGSPCPADEWTLCLFATSLAPSLRYSSIKVYLSAIRSLHIELGFPDPLQNCFRLQRVVRGIKRQQGSSVAQRLPVTDHILLIIFRSLDLAIPDHCMFWAACTLAYFGFLHSSEFTVPSIASFQAARHLQVDYIAVDVNAVATSMRVRIKASKTDPFRAGCFLHIGLGRTPLCAVQAMMQYLALRGDAPGPLFLRRDGQPLSRSLLTSWLRQILAAASIPGNFSSHSFRIGAATVAARNGVPDHLIQALGRWNSNAYQQYIRTPAAALASLSSHLAWSLIRLRVGRVSLQAQGSGAGAWKGWGRMIHVTLFLPPFSKHLESGHGWVVAGSPWIPPWWVGTAFGDPSHHQAPTPKPISRWV